MQQGDDDGMHTPNTLPDPRIYDVSGVTVVDTRTRGPDHPIDGGLSERAQRMLDTGAVDVIEDVVEIHRPKHPGRYTIPVVTSFIAGAVASMAVPTTSAVSMLPRPKPGPSKETRAARKRQKQARKAARR